VSRVLSHVVLITESTNVAHLVTPEFTLCGSWNFDPAWMEYDCADFGGPYPQTQRFVNDYSCRVRRACDGAIKGSPRLCKDCQRQFEGDYTELFHTHQFAYLGVDIGDYEGRHMNREQWQNVREI